MPIDVSNFVPDNTPNPALGQIANTIQENTRYKQEKDYRKQKDEEANQYRNLNLIQDGTDISKSVTGIQAVDKAFADKMKVAYGELLEASKHLSPIELAGMVNEKTQPILSASTAARNDYLNGQKLITEMTAQSKELNRAGLTNDLTGKVINNYIDPKTGQPVNPDMVHPIDFSIYNDPEYLSGFVSDENLVKGIRNPVGAEPQTVLAGKPHSYTEYSTKNTFWTEPTYDKAKIDKQGFYTGGDVPQKRIKSQQVSLGGGNMDVVTDDVYNAFTGDMATHAAIVARAKKEFPTYDKFNDDERELAQKHALYKTITENDDTQFHPTKTVAPPVYHNRTTNNISTGGVVPINDIYKRIDDNASAAETNPTLRGRSGKLNNAALVQDMALDESNLIVDFVNKSYPNKGKDDNPYKAGDLYVKKESDGRLHVYNTEESHLGVLPKTASNIKAQVDVKAKREVTKQDGVKPSKDPLKIF